MSYFYEKVKLLCEMCILCKLFVFMKRGVLGIGNFHTNVFCDILYKLLFISDFVVYFTIYTSGKFDWDQETFSTSHFKVIFFFRPVVSFGFQCSNLLVVIKVAVANLKVKRRKFKEIWLRIFTCLLLSGIRKYVTKLVL